MKGPIHKIIVHAPEMAKPPTQPFGLGDAVAVVAQPIARVIDAVFGTVIVNCGGCKARQETLNGLVPNLRLPTGENLSTNDDNK